MTVIKKKVVNEDGKDILVSNKKRGIDSADKAFDIFLGLYQGLSNSDPEVSDAFKDFSPDFFDLIIIDGKDESIDILPSLTEDNCVLIIEGDRKEQEFKLKTLYPKSKFVHIISINKNNPKGVFDDDNYL